jgi:cyclin H
MPGPSGKVPNVIDIAHDYSQYPQSLPQQNSAVNEEDIYEAGLAHIRTSRLTDAELIYTPSQIALACLSMASETSAAEWMRMKGVELVSVIDAIKACLQSQGSLSEVDAVREVDRRLKLCKNPEKIVGSKAYLAKQEAETRRADERRSRKAAVAQRAMDAQDPFGNTNSTNGDGGPLDDDDDDD